MIELSFNWMMKIKEEKEQQTYMAPDDYENFKAELQTEKISELIDDGNFEESYKLWSNTIIGLAEKHSKKRKKKNQWKSNRLLTLAKKRVQRELNKT